MPLEDSASPPSEIGRWLGQMGRRVVRRRLTEGDMPNGFLPTGDQQLLGWSKVFNQGINATPATFGLSTDQADAYAALHDAYAAALAASTPSDRSKVTTSLKNAARAALKADARLLVNVISGQKNVTVAQRIALGLKVRAMPTPAAVPEEAPRLIVVSVNGRTVTIRLRAKTAGRTKPNGVLGATLFSATGDAPPSDVSQWRFEGNTGRNLIQLTFPETLAPGTKVWLAARWMNTRLEAGPVCDAIFTHLQFGGIAMLGMAMAA